MECVGVGEATVALGAGLGMAGGASSSESSRSITITALASFALAIVVSDEVVVEGAFSRDLVVRVASAFKMISSSSGNMRSASSK